MTPEFYPADWPQIALAVKSACDWRCMACGKQCRRPGELNLGWQFTLTCAHLSSEYDNEVVTVAALCVPCHLRLDAPFVWVARRRRERMRRQLAGQLTLLPVASDNSHLSDAI